MLEIVYKPTFVRQYKKFPKALRQEMKEKIELFRTDPKHSFLKVHKLHGKLKDFYSFSVNYEYRIVFEYESKKRIALLTVGNHDVYK
ncbi:type II toxin-antitoxin system mRNA interferase toxin, RelE/StbE family [Candidatus Gracilibacteria bacterium]|nr:type II toxin-antitoxin system mRNA interferase toxin, RelE/StbE family [Candidatus Gracilibacteria bacterium]MCF7819640.1 type II toxin-antitoxin system mRNA interferase toxin, RelE/StbE family [Candidatus Gracilibacteria bacterium]